MRVLVREPVAAGLYMGQRSTGLPQCPRLLTGTPTLSTRVPAPPAGSHQIAPPSGRQSSCHLLTSHVSARTRLQGNRMSVLTMNYRGHEETHTCRGRVGVTAGGDPRGCDSPAAQGKHSSTDLRLQSETRSSCATPGEPETARLPTPPPRPRLTRHTAPGSGCRTQLPS